MPLWFLVLQSSLEGDTIGGRTGRGELKYEVGEMGEMGKRVDIGERV